MEALVFISGNVIWSIAILGLGVIFYGLYKVYRFSIVDRVHWMSERAPMMDLSEVRPGDDCWLYGKIDSREELFIPHFRQRAVLYWYYKSELSNDSQGNRNYVEVERKFNCIPFSITDGSNSLQIAADDAHEIHTRGLSANLETYRYTASYLGKGDGVFALGVVSDDGKSLRAEGEVPLVLTSLSPMEYSQQAYESAKSHLLLAFVTCWTGLASLTPGLLLSFGFIEYTIDEAFIIEIILKSFILLFTPVAILVGLYIFNSLVTAKNRVFNMKHLIDIDLQQRQELIPKLEVMVKEFCAHEKRLLEKLAHLRSAQLEDYDDVLQQEINQIEKQLVSLSEDNPNLKSSEQFKFLASQLIIIENKIAHSRSFYNQNVEIFNTRLNTLPEMLIAKSFGFTEFDYC